MIADDYNVNQTWGFSKFENGEIRDEELSCHPKISYAIIMFSLHDICSAVNYSSVSTMNRCTLSVEIERPPLTLTPPPLSHAIKTTVGGDERRGSND
jgi:hypothetical protein